MFVVSATDANQLYPRVRKALRRLVEKVGWGCLWFSKKLYITSDERRGKLAETRAAGWFADPRHKTLRLNYPLDAESLVFDVGGFEGDWASDIFSRFVCRVEIFEPVVEFAQALGRRFEHNPRVVVHGFGLDATDEAAVIYVRGDVSSTHLAPDGSASQPVEIRDIATYFRDNEVEEVDLVKLNIEGAEYGLLERVLDAGLAHRVRFLQVQFHEHVPDAKSRMTSIQKRLADTHELMWQYPFVWESWARKDTDGL